MKSKYIILREGYDWLRVGNEENNITVSEYRNLSNYLKKNISKKSVIYDYNKIKFINFVGIINVNNLIIEILPKISLTNDNRKDREMLIFMLSKCNKISVDMKEMINSNILNNSLLDIFAKIFSSALLRELSKGIYRSYVSYEEALTMIKGKISINKSVKGNTIIKNKMYCEYDEFTEDNLLNCIFKKAINIILFSVKNNNIKKELNIVNNILNEVTDIYIDSNTISNYKLNRMNSRFLECFTLAKFILLNSSFDKSLGKEDGFSILFEMNYLYEEYIGVLLKEIYNNEDVSVITQEKNKYLLCNLKSKRNEIALKPDIVVYKNDKVDTIIDTKWKSASVSNKEVYSQGDIYQMYAYITSYLECQKGILLYPGNSNDINHSIWKLNNIMGDKMIFIKEISLDNYYKTKEEIKEIIN